MKFTFLAVLSLIFLCIVVAVADTGTDLKAVTGAHTRVVWIEDNALDKPCVYSERATLRLMGLDSDDGKGERLITDKISSYWKPIITDDGKQVVFGEFLDKTISVINWDGTGLQLLVKGAGFEDVWTDPRTKITWIYGSVTEKRGDTDVKVIRRYQMDKPEVSELVWDKMPVNMFMLSGDGRAASGGGDGGNSPQGMFTLPNGNFSQMAGGCWPSMSPDSSHRMWVFTGNHRSVHMCVPNREGKAYNYTSTFESFPELKSNHELYHPRWSNNIKFITLTGPYIYSDWKWSSDVKISPEGAAKVEVYLGQFSPDYAKIDKWVRISNNDRGDYWPSAWIEPDPKTAAIIEPDEPDVPVVAPAQPDITGLVYQYGYGSTASQVIDPKTGAIRQCNGILRDMARFTRYQVMDLTAGALVPTDADVPLVTGCKASNQLGIEMTINPTSVDLPYDAVILASADDAVNGNFFLLQRGEWLVLRLKTTEPAINMPLCKLTPNQKNHIVVSYAPDKLTCYLNGKRVLLRNLLHGDLSKWTNQHLIVGDAWTWEHNWAGLMEGFAIYSRVIPMPEAQARYNYRQEKAALHTVVKPITIDAKLTYRTAAADPKGIAPYRRCLSINRYTVVKVISGELKDNLIAVAQWSVLDAKVVPSYEKLTKDQIYRLTIEKWEDHPEQESERMMTGEIEGEEPSLFLDVTPLEIPRSIPRKASNVTWIAGDGNWDTIANWNNSIAPGKGDTVLLDNVAAGKRTVTTSQPVNIKELDINQAQTGVLNKLQLGDALVIYGNPKPFAITATEPTGVVLDLNGQPLLIENETLSDVKLSGNIRMAGNGTVTAITVAEGGYDYVKAPTVTLVGGGGKGAAAEAFMRVSDLSITKVGTGYTSNPIVVISAPEISGGRTAVATAYINKNNGTIDRILINNPGSGYTRAPKVTFAGGGGEGGEVEATLSIASFFVSDGGSGYKSMPNVVLVGGGGEGAIVQATSQVSTFRYTGRDGMLVFNNTGVIEQDAATIYFDWAADSRNWVRRNFTNTGTWTMKNGAYLQWISSTGQESWFGRDNTNTGTMSVLSGSRLGMQTLNNTGTLELGANVLLGQPTFYNSDNSISNTGNGIIKVLDGQATLGCVGPSNGKRFVTNGDATGNLKAQLLIGSGKDTANFAITGGNCYLNNNPTGIVEIREGATLALLTNDNGSSHRFNNRDAKFTNAGNTVIAGKLSLQGNHGGAVSIENSGILTISGSDAVFERLMSSCGPGGFYNEGTTARLNVAATGILQGNGKLTYINKTDSKDARFLSIDVKGAISPGDKDKENGKLELNSVQMSLSGVLNIDMVNPNKYNSLQLTGEGDTGKLTLNTGSILNIISAQDVVLHGTFKIITAKAVIGKFEKMRYNGTDNTPYTVNYLADGVEVVFP
jgi:hypothetical protein